MALLPSSAIPSASGGYTIDQSLRFNDDDSAYLSRTPSSTTNRRTWTWSGWVKFTEEQAGTQPIFAAGDANTYTRITLITDGNHLSVMEYNGEWAMSVKSDDLIRDFTNWYHIVVAVDTTQATASNRVKMYINGEAVTSFLDTTYPSQNFDTEMNNSVAHYVARDPDDYLDCYQADVHFIDGTALTASSFGETGDYGEWKPIEYSGTYGTNGFYLDFSNTSTKHAITAGGDAQHSTAQSKIGSSSIAFDGSGDYLTIPQTTDFDLGTSDYTFEFWLMHSGNGSIIHIEGTDQYGLYFAYEGGVKYRFSAGIVSDWGPVLNYTVAADGSNWHHIAIVCNSGTTTMYYDGTSVASTTTVTNVAGNQGASVIGGRYGGVYAYDGYLDEIRISNNARYTGNFTPSTTAFTDDSNTLLLIQSDTSDGSTTFTDSSGVEGSFGNDQSGEDNHFTPNNLTASDQVLDSPTNNFCTGLPLWRGSGTFSEGNLKLAANDNNSLRCSMTLPKDGKRYWEAMYGGGSNAIIGIKRTTNEYSNGCYTYSFYSTQGLFYRNGSGLSSYDSGDTTYGSGDILGFAWDGAAGTLAYYKNNSLIWTETTIDDSYEYVPANGAEVNGLWFMYNFGQDSSFAGNKTAQGETDSNGIGDFYYEPPTDFLALCTSNLPDPAVTPSEHFNAVLYTGTGSNQSVTVGFKPSLTWIKERNSSTDHGLWNAVVGASKYLKSNGTDAESNSSSYGMQSFDSNGFTIGTSGNFNGSSDTYASWNWKAGNETLGTGDFTQGTIASTCSRNVDAGFSIVSYTGNGTSGATVGHGLSSAVELVIVKSRDDGNNWQVKTKDLADNHSLILDNTMAETNHSGGFIGNTFSATTFNLLEGSSNCNNINKLDNDHIAYCFHSIDGYSKVGSYVGNGESSDGTFVYTGFRPKYVLIKSSSFADIWGIYDNERSTYNVVDDFLRADTSGAEQTNDTNVKLDFLSNGFKVRGNNDAVNKSGGTLIYLAIAEQPFKYTNAK